MTYSELQSAIYTYIETNWTDSPITFENTPWKPPESDPWIRVSMFPYDAENVGLGTHCVRIRGDIIIQVFVRYDVGTGSAYALVDSVKALLENKLLGTCIYTYESSANVIGDSNRQLNHIQSDWFQINVNTTFETAC